MISIFTKMTKMMRNAEKATVIIWSLPPYRFFNTLIASAARR